MNGLSAKARGSESIRFAASPRGDGAVLSGFQRGNRGPKKLNPAAPKLGRKCERRSCQSGERGGTVDATDDPTPQT